MQTEIRSKQGSSQQKVQIRNQANFSSQGHGAALSAERPIAPTQAVPLDVDNETPPHNVDSKTAQQTT